jgi:hypothetical protein
VIRPRPFAIAAALLCAHPALAQSSLPTDRYAPTMLLDFWRSHGPGSVIGDDPSENAPGWVLQETVLRIHQPASGPRITQAEGERFKRMLDIAYEALMRQPSLSDIRGASVQVGLNVSVIPTSDGTRLLGAELTLIAKPIDMDDPKTFALNGRFQTPGGEGPSLTIALNPYRIVSDLDPAAEGVTGRVVALKTGGVAFFVSDVPFEGIWDPPAEAAKLEDDQSWHRPDAAGVHPMIVRVAGGRQNNVALRAGKLKQTDPLARLAAAVFMTDWEEVHRKMAALS